MKRTCISLILILTMIVSILAGCASDNETKSDDKSAETAAAGEEKSAGEETAEEPKGMTDITLSEVAHSIFYAPQYVAIEEGYFEEEGINLNLVNAFGADKVMTAVLSGEAEIGFMGAETTVYVAAEGSSDPVVNFAQLTQRAGNFLVSREDVKDFKWEDLEGKSVLGGRKGV